MKTIAFFSEKGGVGKSTLSAMFASYVAYSKRERVVVFDMDAPQHRLLSFRDTDLAAKGADVRFASLCTVDPYPVFAIDVPFTDEGAKKASLEVIQKISGDGTCVFDFPGRFLSTDLAYLFSSFGMIDLMVLLADSDRQSQDSALYVNSELRRITEGASQKTVLLWNREADCERRGNRDWYAQAETIFKAVGVDICPHRVREAVIMRRDPPSFGFVRTTVCWPSANIRNRCPYIEDVFEDIYRRLNTTDSDGQQ